MWVVFLLLFAAVPAYASQESVPLREIPTDEKKLLIELVKRLENGGRLSELEGDDQCAVSTNISSIIKKNDSLRNGAQFLSSVKSVESNDACSDLCCKNITCDLAVFEDKKDNYCYMFRCEGKCKFGYHSSYVSNFITHGGPSLPLTDGSEQDLMDLDQVGHSEDNDYKRYKTTLTPFLMTTTTAAAISIRAHSVGLEGNCEQDFHCEDPNAVCSDNKCHCQQGYYKKGRICRKVCPPSNFECLGIGTLGTGPQCLSRDFVCDSVTQCADGSDEFNCPDTQTEDSAKGRSHGKTSKLPSEPVVDVTANHPKPESSESDKTQGGKTLVDDVSASATKEQAAQETDNTASSAKVNTAGHSHNKVDEGILKVGDDDSDKTADKSNIDKPDEKPQNKGMAGDRSDKPVPSSSSKGSEVSKESVESQQSKEELVHHHSSSDDLIEQQNAFILREKLDLNAEQPSMEGPIIALSLGLAFTFILLILVACRLRNVRHRLKKGRPLHSNEADYLINGMYL